MRKTNKYFDVVEYLSNVTIMCSGRMVIVVLHMWRLVVCLCLCLCLDIN